MSDRNTITDRFYEANSDSWTLMSWNGLGFDNSGHQYCRFLTGIRNTWSGYIDTSFWAGDSQLFPTPEEAENFLTNERVSHPGLSAEWTPVRVGDIENLVGYKPEAHGAVISHSDYATDKAAPLRSRR